MPLLLSRELTHGCAPEIWNVASKGRSMVESVGLPDRIGPM